MADTSIPPVNLSFAVGGIADVMQAFRSISDAAADLDARVKGISFSPARAASARGGKTEAEREADKAEKAAAKAAKAEEKEVARVEKAKQKALDKSVRDHEKAEERKRKATEREAAKAAATVKRVQERAARERTAHKERLANSLGSTLGGSAGGELTSSLMSGGGGFAMGAAMVGVMALKGALDIAAGALKSFGSFVLHDVIRPQLDIKTRAQQLSNMTGGEMSSEQIQSKNRALALKYGMDPTETLKALGDAMDVFGDASKAMLVTELALKTSKGMGLKSDEIAQFFGMERSKLSEMSDKDFNGLMTAMASTVLSKNSSISMGALARLQGKATSPAELIAGDKASAHLATVGLLAYGSKYSSSPAEAATGLQSLFDDLRQHDRAKSVKAGTDALKSPDEVISNFIARTGASSQKLKQLGFADPSARFLEPLMKMFREAEATKKGSGEGVVKDFIREITTPQKDLTTAMLDDAAKKVDDTPGQQLEKSFIKLKDSLLPLMPAAEKVISALVRLEPELETLIDDYVIPWGDAMGESTGLLDLLTPAMRLAVMGFHLLQRVVLGLASPLLLFGAGILKVLEWIPGSGVEQGTGAKFANDWVIKPMFGGDLVDDVEKWARASAEKDQKVPAHMRHARLLNEAKKAPPGVPVAPPSTPTQAAADGGGYTSATQSLKEFNAAAKTASDNMSKLGKIDLIGPLAKPLPTQTPFSDPFRLVP